MDKEKLFALVPINQCVSTKWNTLTETWWLHAQKSLRVPEGFHVFHTEWNLLFWNLDSQCVTSLNTLKYASVINPTTIYLCDSFIQYIHTFNNFAKYVYLLFRAISSDSAPFFINMNEIFFQPMIWTLFKLNTFYRIIWYLWGMSCVGLLIVPTHWPKDHHSFYNYIVYRLYSKYVNTVKG